MRKTLKIFIYLMSILVVLIIALLVTAKLTEDRIAKLALKKVSENIEAPVLINKVSFNLLRKFPFATIELYDVTLGSPQKNQPKDTLFDQSDTILYFKEIFVSVRSKPLIKGNFEIVKVNIEDAKINYHVDTSGVSNLDFLMKKDTIQVDTLPSDPLSFILDDFAAWNITCYYRDDLLKTQAKIVIPELKVNAEVNKEKTFASVIGRLQLSQARLAETNLYLMNNTVVRYDVIYDNDSVGIKTLEIDTDGAKLSLFGNVVLGDEIKTDVKIGGSDLILDELIKYAPQSILDEYGLEKVSGNMSLNASAKGIYSESELPQVELSLGFKDGSLSTKDYPKLKNISFTGSATNGILRNNQSTQADFSSLHFETEKSKFDISFSILDVDHLKYTVNTEMDIDLNEFDNFIPDSLIKNIHGKMKVNLNTHGALPESFDDDFVDYIMANTKANVEFTDLDLEVDPALSFHDFSTQIEYKPNNLKVSNLNILVPAYQLELENTSFDLGFRGSVNKLSEMIIDLRSYQIETKGSIIKGNAKVENIENPAYAFESKIITDLSEAKTMLPDSVAKTLSGNVELNVKSRASLNLDSLSTQYMDVIFKQSEFSVQLKNIYAELYEDSLYTIEKFNGIVHMNPDRIKISKLNGLAGGMEFDIDSTEIRNIYNTLIRNKSEQLLVNTRVNLGDINYTLFAPFMVTDSASTDSPKDNSQTKETVEPTNYTVLIKGVAKVNSFIYDDILIEDISTLFNVTDSAYTLDNLRFRAFNGKMNTSLKYSVKPDNRSVIQMRNRIFRMDINKLLNDFNNFEDYYEPSITAENISGLFSTDMYSQIELVGDSLVYNNLRVRGDIRLENGGVYDFEPATNLSKFTGIKELDNIQFKTLNSRIFISKNDIYVPETFIASNALNIAAYGMQSFGDDYEYHLELKLSDILFGKSKKQRKKEEKAGDRAVDDRNMRELVYYHKDGKTKYGLDNKDMQRSMKTKLKINENLLNLRFHPEMFNFETGVYKSKQ